MDARRLYNCSSSKRAVQSIEVHNKIKYAMRLLLCLAATVFLSESARIARGVDDHFPNSHTVYHGHGAISYQNVHMESYSSVPILRKDHNNYEHYDDLNHLDKEDNNDEHTTNTVPASENQESHDQTTSLQQNPNQVYSTDESQDDLQQYILKEVPYSGDEFHEIALDDMSQYPEYEHIYEQDLTHESYR